MACLMIYIVYFIFFFDSVLRHLLYLTPCLNIDLKIERPLYCNLFISLLDVSNSVEPDQMPYFLTSGLHLHSSLRPFWYFIIISALLHFPVIGM